jgi:two-component system OmpR family response regulator
MRLLVVEDESRLALLLKRGLEEQGDAVDVTGDGAEALWLATEADYDTIVLDVMLPSLDEITKRLRAGGVRERLTWLGVLGLCTRAGHAARVATAADPTDDLLVAGWWTRAAACR